MLFGNYNHTFDMKNRVFLPAKMRNFFDDKVILTPSLTSKCIMLYNEENWEIFAEKILSLPSSEEDIMNYKRLVFGGSADSIPDNQGRILVPAGMREHAKITDKPVLIVGVGDHAELWNPDVYKEVLETLDRSRISGSLVSHGV